MHWFIIIGVLALWLFLGAVFGSHGERIRNAIRNGCVLVADALRTAAQAVMPGGAAVPEPSATPSGDAGEINPAIVVFATIALLAFIAVNGYLLYEITPDLFAFSPDDLQKGAGRFIAWLVPLAILAGEIVGGLIVKSEQRRKRMQNIEASTKVPWAIFLFCYAVELAAGVRRFASFLYAASPFADETTHITLDSVATAALWLALAGGFPWAIFLISRYVEPALGTVLLGISGIFMGAIGVLGYIMSGVVRHLVYAVLFILVIVLIDASGMTMAWLRGWRSGTPPSTPTAAALVLVLASALLSAGCQKTTTGTPRMDRKFTTVSVSDLSPAHDPKVFDSVAEVNLHRYVGEQHKVVQVLEPRLHVCLADVTASVDPELRRALLRRCAELVSELSNAQGPENTGMVVPIVDAAYASKLPVERIEGTAVPTHCTTNPPIPEIPSRSTIVGAKMKGVHDAYKRAERDCTEAVGRQYAAAKRTREEQRSEFIGRVLRELGGRVYQRTDILGALGYVAEFVRSERARLGPGLMVRVSIISDLEDDANGCVLRSGKVTCPDAPMRATQSLLTDANTRYRLYQVLQSTIASRRGSAYVEAKGLAEARQQAWRAFWVSIAPDHVEPFTFTAPSIPTPHHRPSDPSTDDGAAATEGQCLSGDLLRAKHAAMERQTLSATDWVAYGRALAQCGPRMRPWESVGLSDRDQFLDAYVIPFVNGDVAQGSLFRTQETAAYSRIVRTWDLEDG